MAEKKKKKMTWFKIHVENIGVIFSIDSKSVGDALKLAYIYLNNERKISSEDYERLNEGARIAYGMFRAAVDEAYRDYEARVEDGKKGQEKKKQNEQSRMVENLPFK